MICVVSRDFAWIVWIFWNKLTDGGFIETFAFVQEMGNVLCIHL